MANIYPSNYFFLKQSSETSQELAKDYDLTVPFDLAQRVRPGDGILLGTWDEEAQLGEISALCVITGINADSATVKTRVASADIHLKPNPSGRRWWRNEHFRFADSVRKRYMLDDLFCEHFPEYADTEFSPLRNPGLKGERNYREVAGYIYVLHSEYGYKIGKTVSLKDRTRLFSVKLPFKFDIALSGYVANYSKVEADLHRMFKKKRLEGEWFDLAEEDLGAIRQHLSEQS
jgi:Meiotically up-regulated gene 113